MKANYTHIAVLLDESGSMSSCINDTIGGFNRFVADQAATPGEATLSLTTFNTWRNRLFNRVDLKTSLPKLTLANYQPSSSTALVDSLVALIDETGQQLAALDEQQRPSKVIFLVITDGEENASRNHTKEELKQRVEHQQSVYNWEFVYMGADLNAFHEQKQYGYIATSTMSVSKSTQGLAAAYTAVSSNLRSLRSGLKADMSFTSEQRDAQTAAGVDPSLNNPLP